jgi:eukaryotic-like serine/threonine-protein kinase
VPDAHTRRIRPAKASGGRDAGAVTDVAGYRVLRTAAHGARARLLVGHDEGATVVLKVTDAGDPAFPVEAEALHRAAGEHVVALLDAARDDRDAVLVLERLGRGTLADLLDLRASLGAGEAVTILAPLAATVDRLHSAGVAHGALSLAAVCFADDGAPTLVGFGAAHLFPPGAPEVVREGVPGVIGDRAALHGLAGLVLGRVTGERADAARRLAASVAELLPADLAAALFDLAAPTPVRFEAAEVAALVVPRAVEVGDPVDVDAGERVALPPWLIALVPDPVRERLDAVLVRGQDVWSAWDPRRRRLALGLGAAGLTVVLVLAVLPSAPAEPVDAAPLPTPDATPVVAELAEDPVAAAELLLDLRQRCLRDLSLLCLDDVGQPDSAALTDDRMLIRAVQGGGEFPPEGVVDGELTLVERLGDSALIDLPPGSEPASLLLMRTAAGWRIRDYISAAPVGPPANVP